MQRRAARGDSMCNPAREEHNPPSGSNSSIISIAPRPEKTMSVGASECESQCRGGSEEDALPCATTAVSSGALRGLNHRDTAALELEEDGLVSRLPRNLRLVRASCAAKKKFVCPVVSASESPSCKE